MKSVLVTGASSGIGWGTVRVLLRQGFGVFGSVRREEDARRLAGEFGSRFTPVIFDVTDDAAIAAAAGQVRQMLDGERLAGLVNNAGIAVPGPLMELRIEDFRRQLAVNLLGQLAVTQAFLPLLGTDLGLKGPAGRIIMMSSVAGRTGVAFLGPYAASKHALEGMSKSLRQELMMFGIDVIVVAPGSVATPIWDKAEAIDPSWRASSACGHR
jgi:NAD(P)-dependent dehydrogenase (short-subunit alcohol dehydrogenase family)